MERTEQEVESDQEPVIPEVKRRYQPIWERLIKEAKQGKVGKRVPITVRKVALFARIRKAVWKEKSLDLENREKYRLKCEFFPDTGKMEFWLELSNTAENV